MIEKLSKDIGSLSSYTFMPEEKAVKKLLDYIKISPNDKFIISKDSVEYIRFIRSTRLTFQENIIHEYSLSNEEGIAIMCLSEALLRIPDNATIDELIKDKFHNKNWYTHFKKSNSLLTNATSLGLLLTGKIINFGNFPKVIKKTSETLISKAIKRTIKFISKEFILGENLPTALKVANSKDKQGYHFSFDILGESSRTQAQADFFYNEYIKAIEGIANTENKSIYNSHNLSIKLSALHPHVILRKYEILKKELYPKLFHLIELSIKANISITFDAEESFRQDIYLKILTDLITHDKFLSYNGIGLVVQGYQKRTFYIIDYIIDLAKLTKKRILVRLVKGAYWDTEIKNAQENALEDYPIFTKKEYTDVSYIACAQKLLAHNNLIYPQFATHNGGTIATIKQLGKGKEFEFQKLQGMGNGIYKKIIKEGYKCRIYAPIGKYENLLAYLMRRLLENGANNSFINQVTNKEISEDNLSLSPIIKAEKSLANEVSIPLPSKIWGKDRLNTLGYDVNFKVHNDILVNELSPFMDKKYKASSIVEGKQIFKNEPKIVVNPADNSKELGEIYLSNSKELLTALSAAHTSFETWASISVTERTQILRAAGDLLFKNRFELYSLLMREAGKNINDSISEVKEAIDFIYYYAHMAEVICNKPYTLPSYTGELNKLSWHPKGVFICISPWNFPLAIFLGQITAALATGNTVLAKPAIDTSLIATFAIQLMHEAGIPSNALHSLVASGKEVSDTLIRDYRVRGVCFTGSSQTAQSINQALAARSDGIITFIAETGGQNAMIVDSSALLEQATDAIINSAFGSIGQRCSALRVLYIQEEVFEPLIELIIGAMNELKIGNPQDFINDLGPVINKNARLSLENHITEITGTKGCTLIAKHKLYNDKSLKSGNYFVPHIIKIKKISDLKQENFGPILHVISYKAKDLDKVIEDINNTGYGLTFGIQSRIDNRINYIAGKIKAGNIYVNRTIIGAQVGTHPFGGENNSGTGFKAGGPHYLLKFMTERVVINNITAAGGNFELLSK